MSDIKWIQKQEKDAAAMSNRIFNKEVKKRAHELNLEKKENIIERVEYLERKIDALFRIITSRGDNYPIGNFKQEMKRQAEQEIRDR